MPNIDGDVKIRVSLDSKGVEKGADRVKRKMESLGRTVADTFGKGAQRREIEHGIEAYELQAQAVEKLMRVEKERIADLKKMRKEVEFDPAARERADKLGIVDIDAEIDASYGKLAEYRKEIARVNAEIRKSGKAMRDLESETNPVADGISRINKRMNGLARRVFIFGIVLQGLRAMKDGLVRLLKTDGAVSKSMEQIKGSLVAAFMPIYNLCLPAIRWLMSALAQLASGIANTVRQISSLIGSIFGIDTSSMANADALKEQADATTAAGNAAKKAAKSLAAFDEINQLATEGSSGSTGSGGSGGTATGKWDLSGLNNVSKKMQAIADTVLAIGAGIAGWKIAKALGALGNKTWLGNLADIAGNAGIVYNAFRRLLPNIRDIVEEGPRVENVLGAMDGIFGIMGSLALKTGNAGAAMAFFALQAGAAIAQDWDKVPAEMKWWEKAIDPVIRGFKELADIIVKLLTEPFSFELLGEITGMSFSAKAITSVVTGSLISTIGKLFGLSGTIGVKAGIITMALLTAAELTMDAVNIMTGDVEDRSTAMKELITKLLFGAMAAVITVVAGGSGFALLCTIPIGIEIAKTFLDRETTQQAMKKQQEMNSGQLFEALEAAENISEINTILEGFTNTNQAGKLFKNFIGEEELKRLTSTAENLDELRYAAIDFADYFYKQSGTAGFADWLKNLGFVTEETKKASEGLDSAAANSEKFSKKAAEGIKNQNAKVDTKGLKNNAKYLKNTDKAAQGVNKSISSMIAGIAEIAAGVKKDIGDGTKKTYTGLQKDTKATGSGMETVFSKTSSTIARILKGGAKTTGTSMGKTYSLTVDGIENTMKQGSVDASKSMTTTFDAAGTTVKNSLLGNFSAVFAAFTSGGTIFNGIVNGIDNIFVAVVNKLIDGLNNVLSVSFDEINDALDMMRNTWVAGTRPFISLPRVSIARIPKLAEGAVIPANNEFLAVLGDQKQGTNIEAPLDTIVEAVMIAMAKSGMDGDNLAAAVRSALQGMAFKVGKREIGYVVAEAINANRRSDGKLALNL